MCPQENDFDLSDSTDTLSSDPKSASEKKEAKKPHPAISHMDFEELELKLNEVEAQLNKANATIEEHKGQLLRNHAELDNIRKRAQKDVQNAHKYALERLTTELLPVIDSLERGISIETNDNELAKQLHAGLEMTLKLFIDTLGKLSIKSVNPLNEAFDPALHQAISMRENTNVPANTVLQVLQKGYLLHDRLIRPALVVVSK